jgi:hypothetical protein
MTSSQHPRPVSHSRAKFTDLQQQGRDTNANAQGLLGGGGGGMLMLIQVVHVNTIAIMYILANAEALPSWLPQFNNYMYQQNH